MNRKRALLILTMILLLIFLASWAAVAGGLDKTPAIFVIIAAVITALANFKDIYELVGRLFPDKGSLQPQVQASVKVIQDKEVVSFRKEWLKQKDEEIWGINTENGTLDVTGTFPLLDITLRNTTDQPAVIKEAVFYNIYAIPQDSFHLAYTNNVSYETDIVLDPSKRQGDPIHKQIDRVVPGKGVDRFVLVLGQKEHTLESVTYKFNLALLHDDKTQIELGAHRVLIRGTFKVHERADLYSIPTEE